MNGDSITAGGELGGGNLGCPPPRFPLSRNRRSPASCAAHTRLGLVLAREQVVFTEPDWLTIDGMNADKWTRVQ